MIMMMALAFALFLFSMVVLVADSAYLYVWSARVQAAAQTAAQAGANAIDPQYLYGQSDHLVDLGGSGALMAFERGCVQVGDEFGRADHHLWCRADRRRPAASRRRRALRE